MARSATVSALIGWMLCQKKHDRQRYMTGSQYVWKLISTYVCWILQRAVDSSWHHADAPEIKLSVDDVIRRFPASVPELRWRGVQEDADRSQCHGYFFQAQISTPLHGSPENSLLEKETPFPNHHHFWDIHVKFFGDVSFFLWVGKVINLWLLMCARV